MYVWQDTGADYKRDYGAMARYLNEAQEKKEDDKIIELVRTYAKQDLFFLLYFVFSITKINHPWLVKRINEIMEDGFHNTLNLWAREHFKSTILTYGLPIMKLLENPETRIAIFSNTKGMSKKFLRRIKLTLEENKLLKLAYPDILHERPDLDTKWSEIEGLLCKRKGKYSEMTVEAHGVTEAMPTGLHFPIRIYDDLVTWDTTRTADQIIKTKDGFEHSHNLGVTYGGEMVVIGTRYDHNDLYNDMIKSGEYTVREYPGDSLDPEERYWDDKTLEDKKRKMGKYVFATQISLKPLSEDEQRLKLEWIKYYPEIPKGGLNIYILVDPAGDGKKNKSSYTVMMVVGVDWNGNKYVLDIVRDKLDLLRRWIKLRDLYLKYKRLYSFVEVGYEKYSMQADRQFIDLKQVEEHVVFSTVELKGNMNKNDRIRKMIPDLEEGKWFFPEQFWYVDFEQENRNLMKEFIEEEYIHFPNVTYKDMLDALSRIYDEDLNVVYPSIEPEISKHMKADWGFMTDKPKHSWMGI